jgi:hypothetical protein
MAHADERRQALRDRLERDHARLDRMFDELLEALKADAREDVLRLWTHFDDGLCRHMALEDEHLVPELQRDEPREAARIVREHSEMRAKLAELGVGIDLHQVPSELITEFIEQLRQHALHEAAIAYRWTEDEGHLSGSARQQLEAGLDQHDSVRRRLVELGKQARARARAT